MALSRENFKSPPKKAEKNPLSSFIVSQLVVVLFTLSNSNYRKCFFLEKEFFEYVLQFSTIRDFGSSTPKICYAEDDGVTEDLFIFDQRTD